MCSRGEWRFRLGTSAMLMHCSESLINVLYSAGRLGLVKVEMPTSVVLGIKQMDERGSRCKKKPTFRRDSPLANARLTNGIQFGARE